MGFRAMLKNYSRTVVISFDTVEIRMQGLTMLNAVTTPLAFSHLAEDRRSLVQQLIDDSVLSLIFKVLKSVLVNRLSAMRNGQLQKCTSPVQPTSQSRDKLRKPTCLGETCSRIGR